MSLSKNLAKSGRIAACLLALLLAQGAPAGNESASMPAEVVREAMLHIYIHGVTEHRGRSFQGFLVPPAAAPE